MSDLIRLQKYLSEAGVASRRASELLIQQGRVTVNGRRLVELGSKVDPAADQVEVDGRRIGSLRKYYVALHKPVDFVCTRNDERGRRTVLDLLPAEWGRVVYPVGRLDRDSEGLLLLTNDGEFCLRVTHPRHGVTKFYRVTVRGEVPEEAVEKMTRGMICQGEFLRASRGRVAEVGSGRSVLELELTEGRKREVRRLAAALGMEVLRLVRTRVGPVRLGTLRRGAWRMLSKAELAGLGVTV